MGLLLGSLHFSVREDLYLGKYWEHEKDKLIMAAYGVGFAVTTAVMVCEGLFGSSAVWFMFKSVAEGTCFVLELSANWLAWDFIIWWKNNALLDTFVSLPDKLLVATGFGGTALVILFLMNLLNLTLICKNKDLKEKKKKKKKKKKKS